MSLKSYRRYPLTQGFLQVGRTLLPALFALTCTTVAHAQGTMDFSGAQTLMGTFKTFAMYAGAVICLGGLIFAGIRMMSGRFQDAIPGLFGALFGAGVLGWARAGSDLRPSELLIEYVLGSPQSYALAVTERGIHRCALPSKDELEQEATQYRAEILHRKEDQDIAQKLFDGLLGRIPEFRDKQTVIVVPDGRLHLLPFAALADHGQYLVASHLMTVAPSGTVLHILRHRTDQNHGKELPYLGVAAWTMRPRTQTTILASIIRSISGPERSELVALPESQHEVETISSDLPRPNTILLGTRATETNFKRLPLNRYNVIHLALHGYVDPEFPDRSALIFAPQQEPTDDSLLQIREIRSLRLNANLVTLSACNTGVGPIGKEGVASIVNAFIEAGSESVVSTLWELEDHATAHLMTVFYDHLGRHEGKAESLRQAQIEMLKSGAPPYYWAGFVLDGEPSGNLFESSAREAAFRSGE